jgi:N-acetyl-1-D-myo-inositol-2-amino-2-deoxy-alpha-D-glucopyranoside deacetylase
MATLASRRLLLVHAHPDDESIGTGATIAKYAAEGAHVTLVTCTLGEMGEIIPPALAQLGPEELGKHRIDELCAACAELGVTDHRFLGGPGRWRDSGMMGTPANLDRRCFWQADLDEAAAALLAVIREVDPRVIVSYDANGFYGHPDHIQAHRVTMRAYELAADPARRLYATAAPDFAGVTNRIDANAYLDRKLAAMRAHATQITVAPPNLAPPNLAPSNGAPPNGAPPYFMLSNNIRQEVLGIECYTRLAGPPAAATDLFAQ